MSESWVRTRLPQQTKGDRLTVLEPVDNAELIVVDLRVENDGSWLFR